MGRHVELGGKAVEPLQNVLHFVVLLRVGVALAEKAKVKRHALRQLDGLLEMPNRIVVHLQLCLAHAHDVQGDQELLVDFERLLALADGALVGAGHIERIGGAGVQRGRERIDVLGSFGLLLGLGNLPEQDVYHDR